MRIGLLLRTQRRQNAWGISLWMRPTGAPFASFEISIDLPWLRAFFPTEMQVNLSCEPTEMQLTSRKRRRVRLIRPVPQGENGEAEKSRS